MGEEVQDTSEEVKVTGRRDLIGKGALAAAVAAVAGVAMAKPAGAANGMNMVIGVSNSGTLTTQLKGGSTFEVLDGGSSSEAAIAAFQSVSNRAGVYGGASGTVGGVGVWGANGSSQGFGVKGTNGGPGGAGVYGEHSGTSAGIGVVGISAAGSGVVGRGTVADIQADGQGFIWISKAGVAAVPAGGARGAIARDAAGNLWYCHTNGKWTKLAGPFTAGVFHAIDPVRVYDSRAAAPSPGALARTQNRVISVKDGRNAAGTVTAADVVPAGATAVTFNVTVTATTGPNFLSVTPGDAASFTASTLNWPGGFDLANGSTVKLDTNRQIKVFMGDQSGGSHIIVDITGYYL